MSHALVATCRVRRHRGIEGRGVSLPQATKVSLYVQEALRCSAGAACLRCDRRKLCKALYKSARTCRVTVLYSLSTKQEE